MPIDLTLITVSIVKSGGVQNESGLFVFSDELRGSGDRAAMMPKSENPESTISSKMA